MLDSQEFVSRYGARHSNVFGFRLGDNLVHAGLLLIRKTITYSGGLETSSVVIILFFFPSSFVYSPQTPCPEHVNNYNANK